MQGPHFEHLTNSYVETLGLAPWLRQRPEPVYVDMLIADGIKLLGVPMDAYDWVITYNHMLYVRQPDGLSWERLK